MPFDNLKKKLEVTPYDLDPQSAMQAQGLEKLGEELYKSEPVQNIITGEGQRKIDDLVTRSMNGDRDAMLALAQHHVGAASGSLARSGPPVMQFGQTPTVAPIQQSEAAQEVLKKLQGSSYSNEAIRAQQQANRALDQAQRFQQLKRKLGVK